MLWIFNRIISRKVSAKFVHGLIANSANVQQAVTKTTNRICMKVTSSRSLAAIADAMAKLEKLNFDNLALRSLPLDTNRENTVRQVTGACFSRVKPTPVVNPTLVACSTSAMALLDLPESETTRPVFSEYFSGNKLLHGSETASHCYCGHQFGHFSGQLGDGAAMYLGEVVNKRGDRWELQLKGSGLTPYSRTADGRKVLRSSIREFLCSEAMHHLGIPTTRAGSCITSDTKVQRDIFYNGNVIQEQATIVLRIAPTFIRFGSFEIFKPTDGLTGRKGPSVGRKDILVKMLDYCIKTFFPKIYKTNQSSTQKYLEFYREVVLSTARLVAEWQAVGFCHGVLNTDNMSILGLTIDYGPYGFMDRFDQDYICNGSDDGGRYAFNKQPSMCKWNLKKFAEALSGYTELDQVLPLEMSLTVLEEYEEEYQKYFLQKMRKKFGLVRKQLETDIDLVDSFLQAMQDTGGDYTNCFRCLNQLDLPGADTYHTSMERVTNMLMAQSCTLEELKNTCKPRMDPRELMMIVMLMQTNPDLLANLGKGQHMVVKEMEKVEKLKQLQGLTEQDKKNKDLKIWSAWLEKYSDRLRLECKDMQDIEELSKTRVTAMNSNNPKYILRNYIAHNAITCAEKGDFSEVRRVLKLLEHPYDDGTQVDDFTMQLEQHNIESSSSAEQGACYIPQVMKSMTGIAYDSRPPNWAIDLTVT